MIDVDETEESEGPPSCVGERGLRIASERCSTCIFRPGNLMTLRPGRVRDMVDDVRQHDSYVVCHQTLGDDLGVVCRGSYEAAYTSPLQIADRLGFVELVTPKPPKGERS